MRDLHQRGAREWMDGVECVWCSSASPQSCNLPSGMCKSRLCICSTLQPWQIYTAQACVSRAPEAKKMSTFWNSLSQGPVLLQRLRITACGEKLVIFNVLVSSLWVGIILVGMHTQSGNSPIREVNLKLLIQRHRHVFSLFFHRRNMS